MTDTAVRRSRRTAIVVATWLVAVPLLLVLVKGFLPSDHLQVSGPGQGGAAGGLALTTVGRVAGIVDGDLLLAVDGVAVERLRSHPPAGPVRGGEVHTYRVQHGPGGPVPDVAVRVHAHADPWQLLRTWQPDAALVAFAMLGLGIWLLRRRPGEPAAHAFLLLTAGWASSTIFSWAWVGPLDLWTRPWALIWAELGIGGYVMTAIAALLFALSFPTTSRATRLRAWPLAVVLPVLIGVAMAAWVWAHPGSTGDVPAVDFAAELVWQGCTLAALVILLARWFRLRRDLEARRRMQLVVLGFAVTAAIIVVGKWLAVPDGTFGFGLALLVFPLSLAVAVATRGLFALDVILSRTLVALGCSVVLLGLYLGATALTVQVTGADGPLVALPAAGVVAIALAPVRTALSRLVNRQLFGSAGDPGRVLHQLGVRLASSADPESLLAAVTATAAESLRLPYVAVELAHDAGWTVVDFRGQPTADVEHFPITVDDRVVGRLSAAARRDARTLSPHDRDLLNDLARHSGVAARVVGLLTDLRVAQHRLLLAREQERSRIHRDLHDGIGPTLVGLTLQLEVAGELAAGGELGAIIARLHGEAARATDDVRRVVRDLRPGELEELGLPAAVAAAAERLRGARTPTFDLETPSHLPRLAAEVEDAAYKICLEAMTNVVRHSGATRCRITLTGTDHALELEVVDDGHGFDGDGGQRGTGLLSMHERVGAVGGVLTIAGGVGTGTRVHARLPLRLEQLTAVP